MAKPPRDGSPPPSDRPRRTRGKPADAPGGSAPQSFPHEPATVLEASSNKINVILPVETTAPASNPTAQSGASPPAAPNPAASGPAAAAKATPIPSEPGAIGP